MTQPLRVKESDVLRLQLLLLDMLRTDSDGAVVAAHAVAINPTQVRFQKAVERLSAPAASLPLCSCM